MSSIPSVDALTRAIIVWSDRQDVPIESLLQFMDFTGIVAGNVLRVSQNKTANLAAVHQNSALVPADLEELEGITLIDLNTGESLKNLEQIPWSSFVNEDLYKDLKGPHFFAERGGSYYFTPIVEDNTGIRIDYYTKIPTLSRSNPTNWLLQRYPMAYLFGCLMHLYQFTMSDDRAAYWEDKFHKELARIQAVYDKAEWEGSPLTVRRTNYD